VIAIQHTFGGHLNYNPHLHMMVSAGGLKTSVRSWVDSLNFDVEEIMKLWRFAVTSYLKRARQKAHLASGTFPKDFDSLIDRQANRRWNVHITGQMPKRHFLAYAGRYIRRLPISQRRILRVTPDEVVYQSKDTRTHTITENRRRPEELVVMLSLHVLDRYRHSMRYFGLLAPRTKAQTSKAVFALLGQSRRRKPPRQNWAQSMKKHFGVDPLIDSHGQRMRWIGHRLSAATP
jgi:hypothetical protein